MPNAVPKYIVYAKTPLEGEPKMKTEVIWKKTNNHILPAHKPTNAESVADKRRDEIRVVCYQI
jgi:hypothetical protein